MTLRNLFALTVLFSSFLLFNRTLRGKVSARARYLSGVLLAAAFLIPFRFSLISVHIPRWVTEHEVKSCVIAIGEGASVTDVLSGGLSDTAPLTPSGISLRSLMIAVYATGFLFSLGVMAWKHAKFCKTVARCSREPSEEMLWQLRMLCGKMAIRQPKLAVCNASSAVLLGAPFTFGIFRRTVVMPEDVSGEEAEILLEHEFYHLKSRDLWIRVLLTVLKAVYWFYPLVYVFAKTMEAVCEEACDERMTDGKNTEYRADYGKLLVRFASNSPARLLSFSTARTKLKTRIESLFDRRFYREDSWLILLTACLIVGFTSVGFYRNPNYSEKMSGAEYLEALESQGEEGVNTDLLRAFAEAGRLDDLGYGVYYTKDALCDYDGIFYKNALVGLIIVQSEDGTQSEAQTVYADEIRAQNCVGIRVVYGEENGEKRFKQIEILSEKELLSCYAMRVLSPECRNFTQIPDYPMSAEWTESLLLAVKSEYPEELAFYQTLVERIG